MESSQSNELKDYEMEIFSKYILDSKKRVKTHTEIYLGRIKHTNEKIIFKLKKYYSHDSYYIQKESKKYKELSGIKRIPKFYTSGSQGIYHILIIELLGPSLKILMKYVGGKFTLATTLKVGVQLIEIIKEIHNKGIVLRYLKPGNMVIGNDSNKDYIYLIDFEIAKNYIKNGKHVEYKEGKKPKGNKDYISLNTHCGIQISRRDDIECLGYNLIYFMKGQLPWTHLRESNEIKQKKMDISLDELCEGLPDEFKELIKYSKELQFTEEPNYCYLNELLKKCGKKNGIDIDKVKYDWDIKKEKDIRNIKQ